MVQMLLAAIELINFDPIFQKLNSKKKKKNHCKTQHLFAC